MSEDPVHPTEESISSFNGQFTLVDPEGHPFTVKWLRAPHLGPDGQPFSAPAFRRGGTTGWADHNGKVIRVHACLHTPCSAMHGAAKYGILNRVPAPRHGRLRGTGVYEAEPLPLATAVPDPLSFQPPALPSSGVPELPQPPAVDVPAPVPPQPPALPPPAFPPSGLPELPQPPSAVVPAPATPQPQLPSPKPSAPFLVAPPPLTPPWAHAWVSGAIVASAPCSVIVRRPQKSASWKI